MSGRVKFWELRGLSRPLGIQPAGPNSRRVARSVTLDDERAHSGIECSPCSFSIRPLVRHRPTEPLKVFFDVHRAPVSHSTVRAMRGGPLSSFTLPTIQDHSNVGIVVEGSRQICVELLITTRNDVEKPWHRPAPHSPWTSLLRARRRLGARGSHSRGYYFAIPSLGVMSDAPTTSVNATDAPERIKVLMVPSSKFSFMSPVIC